MAMTSEGGTKSGWAACTWSPWELQAGAYGPCSRSTAAGEWPWQSVSFPTAWPRVLTT